MKICGKAGKMLLADTFRDTLYKRLPFLVWLPKYTMADFVPDLIAGITVGLTIMPQAIAYASLAGIHPKYGLYSACFGGWVYIFFGTIKQITIGPTSIMSILTFTYTHDTNPEMVAFLSFMAGVVVLLLGVFRLGFLVEFVSVPVVSGFSSATAVFMTSSQVKTIFGISYKSGSFLETWRRFFKHLPEYRKWDLTLGISCIIVLLFLRKIGSLNLTNNATLKRILWFISTGRNALVVLISGLIAFFFEKYHDASPFVLIGKIDSGLPKLHLPPTHTEFDGKDYDLVEMMEYLGTGIFIVPIVATINNIAVAKVFSEGKIIDASQEMIALGMTNIIGSTVYGMPVASAFSRSAVNNASGVVTPMGGLWTGTLVLLSLWFLTPFLFYIPKASLSAILICAAVFMIEVHTARLLWKNNKRDLIPAAVTFIMCLLINIEAGLIIGIFTDISMLLYYNARPRINFDRRKTTTGLEYWIFTPCSGILFPAVDFLRQTIVEHVLSQSTESSSLTYIVIECSHIHKIDITAAQGIKSLIHDLKSRGCYLIFLDPNDSITRIISGICKDEFISSPSVNQLERVLNKELDECNSIKSIQKSQEKEPEKSAVVQARF
ncbi:sodium-independent sulfate anion transporter [Bemisia tabaci]